MRLLSLCCVIVITSAFPEKDLSSGRSYESEKVDARISGGQQAQEDFFYHTEIMRDDVSICSGAIINPRYVLTAAHCVEDARPQDIIFLYAARRTGAGDRTQVDEIVKHPEYDHPQNNFDIAYLRSRSVLNRMPTYQAANIFDVGTPLPREVTVSGYGYQGKGEDKLSYYLMYVKLPLISQLECQAFYPEKSITKNMICAHTNRDMGKGTCPGDGGAPAVDKGKTRLIGISSFSRGCGPGQGPSVFTFIEAKEIHDFIINGTKIDEREINKKSPIEQPDRPSQEKHEKPSKEDAQKPSNEQSEKHPKRPHRPSKRPHRHSKIPHKPSKEESERPSKGPHKPSKKESERPSAEKPESFSDELPEIPLEDVPEPPSEEKPERPSKEKPERASEEIAERPLEDMPERPFEEDAERPSEEKPERPFDDLTEKPSKEKSGGAFDEIPERLFEELPEEPTKEKSERLTDGISESPFEEKPGRHSREKTERLFEEYSEKTTTN